MAEDQTDTNTKLVVYTIVVRMPKDESTGWSIYGIDTKHGYLDDIVDHSVVELDSGVSV